MAGVPAPGLVAPGCCTCAAILDLTVRCRASFLRVDHLDHPQRQPACLSACSVCRSAVDRSNRRTISMPPGRGFASGEQGAQLDRDLTLGFRLSSAG